MPRLALLGLAVLVLAVPVLGEEEVFLASDPALSPSGGTLVFRWNGDLWRVDSAGGRAQRLTAHPAVDRDPFFSPDGREIAFVSERGKSARVHVMPAAGGTPKPVTFDTNGCELMGYAPDGEHLVVRMPTDREWRRSYRFFRISTRERRAPEMLFDAYGYEARLSPDGRTVLFTREGVAWWRKGYRGPQAGQIWAYDLREKTFTKILAGETGATSPRWLPGEAAFLYVDRGDGRGNLFRYDLLTGERTPVTRMEDDEVLVPAVSADGRVIVFRHGFDLYRLVRGSGDGPQRIRITVDDDRPAKKRERRTLRTASEVAFSKDGLEVAFIAGGDLFVMDTILREPVPITKTPEEESEPVFLPDGSSLLFVGIRDGQGDLLRVRRKDPKKFWWRNEGFEVEPLSEDPLPEARLSLSPDGGRIAFVRGRGDLVVREIESGEETVLVHSFAAPEFDWSPDGSWLALAVSDRNFNRDVFLVPADGSREPVNVSMHPDADWDPVLSPDGRLLAFLSRRRGEETDIHYVWLREANEEETKRDRKLEEAVRKMTASRSKGAKKKPEAKKGPKPSFDLERIHERVHAIRIPDVTESGLLWSPDGKKLAFVATIDGKRGLYTVAIPDDLKPKLLTTTVGSGAVWAGKGKGIRWLVKGVPAVTSARGSTTSYPFTARQEVDVAARYAAGFDLAWRIIRDRFYDPRLNGRNWNAVRAKYRDRAARSPDRETFERIVRMMLGELNGSHLGFTALRVPAAGPRDDWREVTAHLGVRFDPGHEGPGLRIADVIPLGPADREQSRLRAGETILAVNGVEVDPGMDLTLVLNGPPDRDISLRVAAVDGKERTVLLRPTTLPAVRALLYRKWVEDEREVVSELSGGRLGYLHIRGMSWPSFYEFERDIYAAGYGREGLVIDVRDNGGGFTADHLLTALTQPVHAFTISRGGEPGYPQDRKVYATWNRPIVVLINQNSFSNAEIFAHAIRTLGRGHLVGVRTAGGVISTGGTRIMDLGYLRTPGRGWFLIGDGEDMELNGAVPHYEVWPEPGDAARGVDRQLEKAVSVLLKDVEEWKKNPWPKPHYRSER